MVWVAFAIPDGLRAHDGGEMPMNPEVDVRFDNEGFEATKKLKVQHDEPLVLVQVTIETPEEGILAAFKSWVIGPTQKSVQATIKVCGQELRSVEIGVTALKKGQASELIIFAGDNSFSIAQRLGCVAMVAKEIGQPPLEVFGAFRARDAVVDARGPVCEVLASHHQWTNILPWRLKLLEDHARAASLLREIGWDDAAHSHVEFFVESLRGTKSLGAEPIKRLQVEMKSFPWDLIANVYVAHLLMDLFRIRETTYQDGTAPQEDQIQALEFACDISAFAGILPGRPDRCSLLAQEDVVYGALASAAWPTSKVEVRNLPEMAPAQVTAALACDRILARRSPSSREVFASWIRRAVVASVSLDRGLETCLQFFKSQDALVQDYVDALLRQITTETTLPTLLNAFEAGAPRDLWPRVSTALFKRASDSKRRLLLRCLLAPFSPVERRADAREKLPYDTFLASTGHKNLLLKTYAQMNPIEVDWKMVLSCKPTASSMLYLLLMVGANSFPRPNAHFCFFAADTLLGHKDIDVKDVLSAPISDAERAGLADLFADIRLQAKLCRSLRGMSPKTSPEDALSRFNRAFGDDSRPLRDVWKWCEHWASREETEVRLREDILCEDSLCGRVADLVGRKERIRTGAALIKEGIRRLQERAQRMEALEVYVRSSLRGHMGDDLLDDLAQRLAKWKDSLSVFPSADDDVEHFRSLYAFQRGPNGMSAADSVWFHHAAAQLASQSESSPRTVEDLLRLMGDAYALARRNAKEALDVSSSCVVLDLMTKTTVEREEEALDVLLRSEQDPRDAHAADPTSVALATAKVRRLARLSVAAIPILTDVRKTPGRLLSIVSEFIELGNSPQSPLTLWAQNFADEGRKLPWFGDASLDSLVAGGEGILQTLTVEDWPKLIGVGAERDGIKELLKVRSQDGRDALDQKLEQLRSATLVQDPRLTPSARFLSEICHRLDGLASRSGSEANAIKDIVSLARLLAEPRTRNSSVNDLVRLLSFEDSKPEAVLKQNLRVLADGQLVLLVAPRGCVSDRGELCGARHHTHGVCVQVQAARGSDFRMMGHGRALTKLGCMDLPDMMSQLLIYATGESGSKTLKHDIARISHLSDRVQRARELGDKLHAAMRVNVSFQPAEWSWGKMSVRKSGTLRVAWKQTIPQTTNDSVDIDEAADLLPRDIDKKTETWRVLETKAPWVLRLRSLDHMQNSAWNETVARAAVQASPEAAREALYALRRDADARKTFQLIDKALEHAEAPPNAEDAPSQKRQPMRQNLLPTAILLDMGQPGMKKPTDGLSFGGTMTEWAARAMSLIGALTATSIVTIDDSFSELGVEALLVGLREAARSPDRASYCLANTAGLVVAGIDALSSQDKSAILHACADYACAVRLKRLEETAPVIVLISKGTIALEESVGKAFHHVIPGQADEIFNLLIKCPLDSLQAQVPAEDLPRISYVEDLSARAAGAVAHGQRVLLRKDMTITDFVTELRSAERSATASLSSAKSLVLDCLEDASEVFQSPLGVALAALLTTRVVGADCRGGPFVWSQGRLRLMLEIAAGTTVPFCVKKCKSTRRTPLQPAQESLEAAARLEQLAERARHTQIDEAEVRQVFDCESRRSQHSLPFVYTPEALTAMAQAIRCIPPAPGREGELAHAIILAGDTGTGKTYLCIKLQELLARSRRWKVGDLARIWSFSAAFGHAELNYLGRKVAEDAQMSADVEWGLAILDEVTASPAQSSLEALVRMRPRGAEERNSAFVEREGITARPLFLLSCNPDTLRDEVFPLARTLQAIEIRLARPPLASTASYVRANFARFAPNLNADKAAEAYLGLAEHFNSQRQRKGTDYGVLSSRDAAQCAAITGDLDAQRACLSAVSPDATEEHALALALYLVVGIRIVPRSDFYAVLDRCLARAGGEPSWNTWFKMVRATIAEAYEVPSNIVRTVAFEENLLVLSLGMLTRQPVLLLGNDGMSKSLSIRLAMRQMRGNLSSHALLRDHFPRVQSFALQFSPRTSAALVRQLGNALVSLQGGSSSFGEAMPCAVMEELSMARMGPEGPLRALHGLLDDHQMQTGRQRERNAGSGSNTFGFCATSNFLPERPGAIPVGRALANRILVLVHEEQSDEELIQMANAAASAWTEEPLALEESQLLRRVAGKVAVRDLLVFARALATAPSRPWADGSCHAVTCAAYLQRRSRPESLQVWKAIGVDACGPTDHDAFFRLLWDMSMPKRGLLIVYESVRDLSDWLHKLDERLCPRLVDNEAYVLDLLSMGLPAVIVESSGAVQVKQLASMTESDLRERLTSHGADGDTYRLLRSTRQTLLNFARRSRDLAPIVPRADLPEDLDTDMEIDAWVAKAFTSFTKKVLASVCAALKDRNVLTPGALADMSIADFVAPRWRNKALEVLSLEMVRSALRRDWIDDATRRQLRVDANYEATRRQLRNDVQVLDAAIKCAHGEPSAVGHGRQECEVICVSDWARCPEDASQESLLRLRTSLQHGGTAVLVNPEPVLDSIHALLNDLPDSETSTVQMGTSFETVSIAPTSRLVLCMHASQLRDVHPAVLSRVSVLNSGYPIPLQMPSEVGRPVSVYSLLAARVKTAGHEWPTEEDKLLLEAIDDAKAVFSSRPGKRVTIVSSDASLEPNHDYLRVSSRDHASLPAFARAGAAELKRKNRHLYFDLSELSRADTVNVLLLLGLGGCYHQAANRLRPNETLCKLFEQQIFLRDKRAVIHVSPQAFPSCIPNEELSPLVDLLEVRDTNRNVSSEWPSLVEIATRAPNADEKLSCVARPCRELLKSYLLQRQSKGDRLADATSAAALARLSVDDVLLKTWAPISNDPATRMKAWRELCAIAEENVKSLRTLVLEDLRGALFRCADFVVRTAGGTACITGARDIQDDDSFWQSDEEIARAIFGASSFKFQQRGCINAEQSSSMMAQTLARAEANESRFPCSAHLLAAVKRGAIGLQQAFPALATSNKRMPRSLVSRLLDSLVHELALTWRLAGNNGLRCPPTFVEAVMQSGAQEPKLSAVLSQFWRSRHQVLLLSLVEPMVEFDATKAEWMDQTFDFVAQALRKGQVTHGARPFARILRYCKADGVKGPGIEGLDTLVELWLAFEQTGSRSEPRQNAVRLESGAMPRAIEAEDCAALLVRLEGVRARLKAESIARLVELFLQLNVSEPLLARVLRLDVGTRESQANRIGQILASLEEELVSAAPGSLCRALRLVALELIDAASLRTWVRFMSPPRGQTRVAKMSAPAWELLSAVFGARAIEIALGQDAVKSALVAPLLRTDAAASQPLRNFTIRTIVYMHGEAGMEQARAHLEEMSSPVEHEDDEQWFEPFMNPPRKGVDEMLACVPGFQQGGPQGLWDTLGLSSAPAFLHEGCEPFAGPALLWNALIAPDGALRGQGKGFAAPGYAQNLARLTLPGVEMSHLELVRSLRDGRSVNRCSNCGFPYSIGNCGMPMETARCPGCRQAIGGENHNFINGRNQGVPGNVDEHIVGLPATVEMSSAHHERNLKPLEYRILWLLMLFPLLLVQHGGDAARVEQAAKAWQAFKAVSGLYSDEEASSALMALLLAAYHRVRPERPPELVRLDAECAELERQIRGLQGGLQQQQQQQQLANLREQLARAQTRAAQLQIQLQPGHQQGDAPNLALSEYGLELANGARANDHRQKLEKAFQDALGTLHADMDLKEWLGENAKQALHRANEEQQKHPLVQLRQSQIKERARKSADAAAQIRKEVFPEACELDVRAESPGEDVVQDGLWNQRERSSTSKPLTVLGAFVDARGAWSGDRFEELLKHLPPWAREIPRVSRCLGELVKGARKMQRHMSKRVNPDDFGSALELVKGALTKEEAANFVRAWDVCRRGHQFECQAVDDLGGLDALPATDALIVDGQETALFAMLKTLVDAHNEFVEWIREHGGAAEAGDPEEVALFEVNDMSAHLPRWDLLGVLVKVNADSAVGKPGGLEQEIAWSSPVVRLSLEESWPATYISGEDAGRIVRIPGLPGSTALPQTAQAELDRLPQGEPMRRLLEQAQAVAAQFAAGVQRAQPLSPNAEVTLLVAGQGNPMRVEVRHLEILQERLCRKLQPKKHDHLGKAFRHALPGAASDVLSHDAEQALRRKDVIEALSDACAEICGFENGDMAVRELVSYCADFEDLPGETQEGIRALNVPCMYLHALLEAYTAASE